MDTYRHDGILVVGAGLAGLTAALAAAPRKVLVVSERPLAQGCASAWAQGGMAAALDPTDSPERHADDTVAAGAGLVDPAVARLLATEGPDAVRYLASLGAPFDRNPDGSFAQSLEAAHSHARVARVQGDGAGAAIMASVIAATCAAPHIEVRVGARLCGLVQDHAGAICGIVVEGGGTRTQVLADAVILATGGIGGLYAVTTTPAELVGDGLALAARAGATIADPEFVQFHPTAIDIGCDPAPLATEALRGEGAILVNAGGRAFMADYHPDRELAPRDVVARAIHAERLAGRGAFLDGRSTIGLHFPTAFPAVFAACQNGGIDPRLEPIPVVPACHYHMGGIVTDVWGATSLAGLYAAGECASTGAHGANRLASNSLLEAAVFGRRAGQAAARARPSPSTRTEPVLISTLPDPALQTLRKAMSRDAGVVRDATGLGRLIRQIDALHVQHGQAGALIAARLVATSALARRESRGGHWRSDAPGQTAAQRTYVATGHTPMTIAAA